MFYLTPILLCGMGKVMLWTGTNFYNHIEIVHVTCVTCPNILQMGFRMGATEGSGKTPVLNSVCLFIPYPKI